MMRLPRFLPSLMIACSCVALPVVMPQVAIAQETDTTKPAAPASASSLQGDVEEFWHLAKTFRYQDAATQGKKIADAKPDPRELLQRFEAVSEARKDNLDQWMLRWEQVPELRDTVDQLLNIMKAGHQQRRADQGIIEANVKRLSASEQSYAFAMGHLRESGELAVPVMIDYLRDPAKKEYHAAIRRALVDMGRLALSPLVAAVEAPVNEANQQEVVMVISALSEIGYDVSIPPLVYLANNANAPEGVRAAAKDALIRMGAGNPANMDASEVYYDQGQRYYYGKAATSPDGRSDVALLWLWDAPKGLVKLDLPAKIWGDIMAMQAARRSLQVNQAREDSMSLWLAANYGREVHLPAGKQDPTRTPETLPAHYFGVASGAKYLNMVLTRSLGDRDTGVALAAVKSLAQIGGESNLFAAGQSAPLVSAMRYPDRVVRFEAAFAAAAAMPRTNFEGQERVVPILAEALAQTGKPGAIAIMPEDEGLNKRVQELKDAGYNAAGVSTAEAAAGAALPAIDVVVVSDEDPAQIEKLRDLAASTPRLQGAAIVIITQTQASPFAVWAAQNPLITVTQAKDMAQLKGVLESARSRAGAPPMDEKVATEYAVRAANLLAQLAISRGEVLDLGSAQTALLQALDDARPEIVKAAARALAYTPSRAAQSGLLAKAVDSKTEGALKVSLYNALASNARAFGNVLDGDEIKALQNAVISETAMETKGAAAEAHGALNLPADQVKALFLK